MKVSGPQIDKFIFSVVILDLMFFPYIRALSASLSMVVLPFWFVFRSNVLINDNQFRFSVVAIMILFVSFFHAAIVYSDGIILRNGNLGSVFAMLPNAVVVLYMIIYYLFFRAMIIRYKFKLKKFLFSYLVFVLCLVFLFFYDPALYFKVRSFWTMYGNEIEVAEFGSAHRFTSTLSDPNNIAGLICAVAAYLIFDASTGFFLRVFALVAAALIVIGTMSSSGAALFCFVLALLPVRELILGASNSSGLFLRIFSGLSVILFFFILLSYVLETPVGQIAIERAQSNSMDSRFDIWSRSIELEKFLSSLFFGDGGLPVLDGRVINPHNGHIYLIYSFGFVFNLIFVYLFFISPAKKVSFGMVFLIPLFVCFTINVGIYELRFAGIMSLLIAAYKGSDLIRSRSPALVRGRLVVPLKRG